MKELTARQREILDYIVGYQGENGFPPTVREIAKNFGINSPNGVMCHTQALIKKGFLGKRRNKSRSMMAPRKEVSRKQLGQAVALAVQDLNGLPGLPDAAWSEEIGAAVANLFGWKEKNHDQGRDRPVE